MIPTNLAVEHVRPKEHVPNLELEWENFLLACSNCNSCKGHTDVQLHDYVWPHLDNTLLAFIQGQGGVVEVSDQLSEEVMLKAASTLRLVGLDKRPGHPDLSRRPAFSDRRWKDRLDARDEATLALGYLQAMDDDQTRELIVTVFKRSGHFSIWFSTFAEDADMRRRLVEAWPGTAAECFDGQFEPVQRAGGAI